MILDLPHIIRIRLAWLIFLLLLRPDVAKALPCWLSQFSFSKLRQPTGQRQSNIRMQQKKSIRPILFLYYEESLVSSNLNSKLFRFHCVRPNVHITLDISSIHFVMNPMQFQTLNSSWQSNFLKIKYVLRIYQQNLLRFTPGFSAHFPISTLHLLQLVYFDKSLDAICSPPEHKNLSV